MSDASAFSIRLAHGDLVDVRASMIAIGHVNDVAPTGAERAIDELMSGAISRRTAALRGRLGEIWFLPTLASPVAAGCVVVVSLGEAEHFTPRRLPEVGAAIVEAAATIGATDAATIVHGAGNADVDLAAATRLLVCGVLEARRGLPGGEDLRELTIVERDEQRLEAVRRGLADITTTADVHVYSSELAVRRRVVPVERAAGTPLHLRFGVTRAGPDLKITRIGDGAFDPTFVCPYPAQESEDILGDLERALTGGAGVATSLEGIGERLWTAFLGAADIDADKHVENAPGGLVVLRLDGFTVDLPWELLRPPNAAFVSRRRVFARQIELGTPGRPGALVPPYPRLRALVIGDPRGDLAAAAREAHAVATALAERANAEVDTLIGDCSYGAVSRMLDAKSYDVLHYAGHAQFVSDRPDRSGLMLNDHLLTPGDLAARRYVPRLVVANACHSAAGAAGHEPTPFAGTLETRSLVGGLLAAGARAFVGAHWAIADTAAATFATAFYEAVADVLDGPQSIGEAVRRGREAIVAEHGENEDSWAAYGLYGSPWRPAIDVSPSTPQGSST